MKPAFRGSRKHILDWVECSDFVGQLSQLIRSTGAIVQATDVWMPRGYNDPEEARLEQHGSRILPTVNWQALQDWWLVCKPGANTPNWDLVSACALQGQKGLVLIEAKAHTQELKAEGKHIEPNASSNSHKNHDRIGQAIDEASNALSQVVEGINLSRDTHYQLANRIAFSWKIASLGIPVVLVYLGFIGDKDIADIGEPLEDDMHWQQVMRMYMSGHVPEGFTERWVDCGKAFMQMIIRSLSVNEY